MPDVGKHLACESKKRSMELVWKTTVASFSNLAQLRSSVPPLEFPRWSTGKSHIQTAPFQKILHRKILPRRSPLQAANAVISAQKEGFGNEFAWRKEQDLGSLGWAPWSVGWCFEHRGIPWEFGGDFSCFFESWRDEVIKH